MAIQISRVNVERFKGVRHGHAKIIRQIDIPNALQQKFSAGVQLPTRDILFHFQGANVNVLAEQVQEMLDNPWFKWGYIKFPAGYWQNQSGFYLLEKLTTEGKPQWPNYLECTLTASFLGASNLHVSTYWWGPAIENYSGFATLPTYEMVSVPNTATNIDNPAATTLGARSTADGATIAILDSPTRQNIYYALSQNPANWYPGECRIFDTITAGNSNEATWRQVYSPAHSFLGDIVIDNGLLRYRVDLSGAASGLLYVWDSVTSNAWVYCGQLGIYDAGSNVYPVVNLDIVNFSSEEIRWREVRMYSYYVQTLTCTLRRGAYHLRVQQTSSALANNQLSVALYKLSGFTQLFNAGANGAAGGGNLASQLSSNYECGYNTSDQVVSGFALIKRPTYQPYDPGAGGHAFPESNGGGSDSWPASTQRTYFIIAWPQNTSSFNLTAGRANAAEIAAQCLYSLNQELILPASGRRV